MKVPACSFVLALAVSVAASDLPAGHNHRGLMRRLRGAVGFDADSAMVGRSELAKRAHQGRATYYDVEVGRGACGGQASNSDNTVALNIGLYGNPNAVSSWCGRTLVITSGGVTQTAVVGDCCPTCPGIGDLDMSSGLFSKFTALFHGVTPITWHVAGEGDSSSSSSSSNSNEQSVQKPASDRPAATAARTYTILSTVSASTSTSALAAASSLPATASTAAANATATAPALPLNASSTDTDAPTSSEPAQNLAGLKQLLTGMFSLASGGQDDE